MTSIGYQGYLSKTTGEKAAMKVCVVTPRVAASAGQPSHVTTEIGVKLGAARGVVSKPQSARGIRVRRIALILYSKVELEPVDEPLTRKLREIVLVRRNEEFRSFDDFAGSLKDHYTSN